MRLAPRCPYENTERVVLSMSPTTRLADRLRYLCYTLGVRETVTREGSVGPAWATAGRRKGAVLLAAVVAHGMGADELAVLRDLHRVAHYAHLDLLAAVAVADAVAGAGEADAAGVIDHAQHRPSRRLRAGRA